MRKVVYIAGPYRGANTWEIESNIRRAEALALDVWRAGAAALCPHANTRFFQGALPDSVWLKGDLAMLAKCDAILMTDNWSQSVGACAERDFAVQHDIPVFYGVAALRAWLRVMGEPLPTQ